MLGAVPPKQEGDNHWCQETGSPCKPKVFTLFCWKWDLRDFEGFQMLSICLVQEFKTKVWAAALTKDSRQSIRARDLLYKQRNVFIVTNIMIKPTKTGLKKDGKEPETHLWKWMILVAVPEAESSWIHCGRSEHWWCQAWLDSAVVFPFGDGRGSE